MSDAFEADLLTLIDDEGTEHEFEVIDEISGDDGHFLALIPTLRGDDEIAEADTYYIFEVVDDGDEEQLQEVDDDELLDKLAEIFESRFNDAFYEEEE